MIRERLIVWQVDGLGTRGAIGRFGTPCLRRAGWVKSGVCRFEEYFGTITRVAHFIGYRRVEPSWDDWRRVATSEPDRTKMRSSAGSARHAALYGGLAVAALVIFAINVIAMAATFWKPSLLLTLPLSMMFAAVSLWAGVSFWQTRAKMLSSRDESDESRSE